MTTSTHQDLLSKAANLRVWSNGWRRAPHKPLLILLAVHRAQHGLARTAPWSWWRDHLTPLLQDYAPNPSVRASPHNPFRFLISDQLWEVDGYDPEDLTQFVKAPPGATERARAFKVTWLNQTDPEAGLPREYHDVLASAPRSTDQLVRILLQIHFPPTLWTDLLASTGVTHDLGEMVAIPAAVASIAARNVPKRTRDAEFAAKVHGADGYRCVVCRYDGHDKQHDRPVGLDAAHVKWHHVGGPDTLANGATLCPTHHRLFDRGMFCWEPPSRLLLPSPHYAHDSLVAALPVNQPAPERLKTEFLLWQYEYVFRR